MSDTDFFTGIPKPRIIMKKRQLLFLLACFMACVAKAAPVDQKQAQQLAQDFFAKKGISYAAPKLVFKAPGKQQTVQTVSYYVFNATGRNGFVLVSGDDRTVPILGYSDHGSLDTDNLPPNVKAWLEGYHRQIDALGEETAVGAPQQKAPATNRRAAEATKKPIAPLLTTTWNQNSPYNDLCPRYGFPNSDDTKACVTGCVATALAQVMYYYKWPAKTYELIPGYTNPRTVNGFTMNVEEVAADTPIDWANMCDNYQNVSDVAKRKAVAELMLYCGTSVEMAYGPSSSASCSDIPYALKTYFGYQGKMKYINRKFYLIDEWDQLIFNELLNSRPVIYDGQSTGGGHAFVVDGYDGDGLYHVNWGWGGMSDGYFVLSVMNPNNNSGIGASSSSDGYSMDQGAVIGIQVEMSGETLSYALTSSIIGLSDNTISAMFENSTGFTHVVKGGIGIVGSDGKVILLKSWGDWNGELENGEYYPQIDISLNKNEFSAAGLEYGTYKVVPVSLVDSDTEWQPCHISPTEYVEAVYDENGVTLTLHTAEVNLEVTSFDFPGSRIAGMEQPVNMIVKNNGDEYSGLLHFFVNDQLVGNTGVAIAAGKNGNVSFRFTPSSSGLHTIAVALDEDGANMIGTAEVEITAGSAEQSLEVVSFTAANADPEDNKTIYGTTLKGTAVIKNTASSAYAGGVLVYLLENTDATHFSSVQQNTYSVEIPAGGSQEITVQFEQLNTDKYYWVSFRYTDGNKTKLTNADFYAYDMEPGLVTWNSQGEQKAIAASSSLTVPAEAIAVDLTGTGVSTVVPNDNPNTLYYLGDTDAVPSGLEGKNIVQGSTAASIVLTDEQEFFVPKTFTATEATYTQTPTLVTSGTGGWTTLVLPFAVSSVTNATDNKPIDWFHSRTDTDKDFWVKRFAELEGSTVLFDFADVLEANVPYIVAYPGNKWGEEFNLGGKQIVYEGENVRFAANARMLASSSLYNFVGATTKTEIVGGYALNDAGTNFGLNATVETKPFRAYFVAKTQTASMPKRLNIGSYKGQPTEILMPFAAEDEQVAIYSLNGQMVRMAKKQNGCISLEGLPKGVYVVKGKKVVW